MQVCGAGLGAHWDPQASAAKLLRQNLIPGIAAPRVAIPSRPAPSRSESDQDPLRSDYNPGMRIGMLTGGGDCPALNAVIRAAVKTSVKYGWDVLGIEEGFE